MASCIASRPKLIRILLKRTNFPSAMCLRTPGGSLASCLKAKCGHPQLSELSEPFPPPPPPFGRSKIRGRAGHVRGQGPRPVLVLCLELIQRSGPRKRSDASGGGERSGPWPKLGHEGPAWIIFRVPRIDDEPILIPEIKW